MTHSTTIRTRPDGSIDAAHYIERGRYQRSAQAHRMAGGTARKLRPLAVAAVCFALIGLVFPFM